MSESIPKFAFDNAAIGFEDSPDKKNSIEDFVFSKTDVSVVISSSVMYASHYCPIVLFDR